MCVLVSRCLLPLHFPSVLSRWLPSKSLYYWSCVCVFLFLYRAPYSCYCGSCTASRCIRLTHFPPSSSLVRPLSMPPVLTDKVLHLHSATGSDHHYLLYFKAPRVTNLSSPSLLNTPNLSLPLSLSPSQLLFNCFYFSIYFFPFPSICPPGPPLSHFQQNGKQKYI